MKLLVTGGAGYIGSLTVKKLLENNHQVVVFDNLVYGHKESITCPLVIGDLLDKAYLFSSLDSYDFDAVIHFAAYAYPGESMEKPGRYFRNNVVGGLNLLEFMLYKKIHSIVFSSSCAVFGKPEHLPIKEDDKKTPESVYGESKLLFEKMLDSYQKSNGIQYLNLRYFNAAGASLDGTLGEDHTPEAHLIPLALQAVYDNKPFNLFGNDYQSKDGTAVRDFIHIEDLAIAHMYAMKYLVDSNKSDSFNLGSGKGYSIKEVLSEIESVTGKKVQIDVLPRRIGDPPEIYADTSKSEDLLGFVPKHSDLKTIITTAWKWYVQNREKE